MTEYEIIGNVDMAATQDVFALDDESEQSVMIRFKCPKCGVMLNTVWLYPSTEMIFTTDCCGAVVIIEPDNEELINVIGQKGADAYIVSTEQLEQHKSNLIHKLVEAQARNDKLAVLVLETQLKVIHFNQQRADWFEEIETGREVMKE